MINLFLIKVYFGRITQGFELLPYKHRGQSLFGITWDIWEKETKIYVDIFYKNIMEKTIKEEV